MLKKLICLTENVGFRAIYQNLPDLWERVSVQGMLVWFLTKDFVSFCFLDNFLFIYFIFFLVYFCHIIYLVGLFLIGAVSYNFDTPFLKS